MTTFERVKLFLLASIIPVLLTVVVAMLSPALWRHGSSTALEFLVGLWFLVIFGFVAAYSVAFGRGE